MEERQTRVVGHEVDLKLLKPAQHHDILDHASSVSWKHLYSSGQSSPDMEPVIHAVDSFGRGSHSLALVNQPRAQPTLVSDLSWGHIFSHGQLKECITITPSKVDIDERSFEHVIVPSGEK